MSDNVTYASYLDLDRILAAQHPSSEAHDELLFIIVHQASELWLKLCLHELTAARACIEADDLRPAFKMLARVARAQQQLIQSWDVLSTMTPHDYSAIRPYLGASSGFQSAQYRMMEFMLGGRDGKHIRLHKDNAGWAGDLEAECGRASLYDAAIRLLAKRGLAVDEAATKPVTQPHLMCTIAVSKQHGRQSTATRRTIGISTNWPKSWSISNTTFSAGALAT
jgi:tryptophan 2,3-dioxygenase